MLDVLNNLTGFYRGVVLKHLDNGFCKVWIPGVYPESWKKPENIDKIPDAEQANLLLCASNEKHGVFSYPLVDSTVWCFFVNNDPSYPVYFAATLAGSEASSNYSKIKPLKDKDADSHIIMYKDSSITINNETDGLNFLVKKNINGSATGSCLIQLQKNGNIKIKSSNDIELTGQNIKINGDKSITLASNIISIDNKTQFNINSPYIKTDMRGNELNSFVVITNDNESHTIAGL